jgi:hypothetical protein
MIENDEQLRATHEASGNLYRALASLRQTVLPVNARQYDVLAEGPLDEIQKLQSEISGYLGLPSEATGSAKEAALREELPPYGRPKE